MEIRPLTALGWVDLARIASGYTSTERLEVRVVGTDLSQQRFELEAVPVDPPYVRDGPHAEVDVARLNDAVRLGTSFGAWEDGRLAAFAITERMAWNRNLVLDEFHVAPTHRRRGVGRALMNRVVEAARTLDVRSVSAETQNTNMPAIRFYRDRGFTLQGLDLSLYDRPDDPPAQPREVALYMRRFV